MSAPFDTNHSVADQQIAHAKRAVLIAPGAEQQYGYATLTGSKDEPEVAVYTFATKADMDRALSEAFKGRLLSDLYPDVFVFGPDSLPHGQGTVEWDDDQFEEALYERASREGNEA